MNSEHLIRTFHVNGSTRKMRQKKIAIVTGANRGIGYEVCRQLAESGYQVILTARNREKGKKAAEILLNDGLDVKFRQVDISDRQSITNFATNLGSLPIHILVNNAAIYYDSYNLAVKPDFILAEEAIQTNVLGAWRMITAILPLMKSVPDARIVNVSSASGMMEGMGGGAPAYSLTKAALNVLTIKLAAELSQTGIKVNAVCPGWVRTDMGGSNAPRSVEQGAKGIVWAATLPYDGPTGGFFRDGKRLPW
jgi:NAD(P)-dependent dehydrogenase (short-subunit alcohol dehydrogenase family)